MTLVIVCTMEMTFAGNCGNLLDLTLKGESHFETLFAKDFGFFFFFMKLEKELEYYNAKAQ